MTIGALALERATALKDCLCAALAATIGGPACQCCVRPGTAPPSADACCACGSGQGQASVQITRIFPTQRFPVPGVQGELTNCATFGWAAELTMTVYRCVSCADETGFPSCDELTADAAKIADDASAMWRAAHCCDWRQDPNEPEDLLAIVAGEWRPLAPQGCCAGGMMPVTVWLGSACCPP